MPNVIISPSFAQLRARSKYAQYGAIASGIEGAANITAQALLTYSIQKKQEDDQKLALLTNMISTYGNRVGQPALKEMDSILKRKGVGGLPKDPTTGEIALPPATLEQMKAEALRQDPNLLKSALQKEMTGMSPIQQAFKEREIQLKERHQRVTEEYGRINADAHMISAKAQLARASKDDELSPIVQMPDGSLKSTAEAIDPETGQVAPGAVALTGKQAKLAIEHLKVKNDQAVKAKDQELKQSKLELDHQRVANKFSFDAESTYFKLAKAWGDPKTTEAQRRIMRPKLEHALRNMDVPEEDIKGYFEGPKGSGFFGYFGKFFQPKEHQPLIKQIEKEQAAKGINPPEIPGIRKLKSGKVIQEEVVPNPEGQ